MWYGNSKFLDCIVNGRGELSKCSIYTPVLFRIRPRYWSLGTSVNEIIGIGNLGSASERERIRHGRSNYSTLINLVKTSWTNSIVAKVGLDRISKQSDIRPIWKTGSGLPGIRPVVTILFLRYFVDTLHIESLPQLWHIKSKILLKCISRLHL